MATSQCIYARIGLVVFAPLCDSLPRGLLWRLHSPRGSTMMMSNNTSTVAAFLSRLPLSILSDVPFLIVGMPKRSCKVGCNANVIARP